MNKSIFKLIILLGAFSLDTFGRQRNAKESEIRPFIASLVQDSNNPTKHDEILGKIIGKTALLAKKPITILINKDEVTFSTFLTNKEKEETIKILEKIGSNRRVIQGSNPTSYIGDSISSYLQEWNNDRKTKNQSFKDDLSTYKKKSHFLMALTYLDLARGNYKTRTSDLIKALNSIKKRNLFGEIFNLNIPSLNSPQLDKKTLGKKTLAYFRAQKDEKKKKEQVTQWEHALTRTILELYLSDFNAQEEEKGMFTDNNSIFQQATEKFKDANKNEIKRSSPQKGGRETGRSAAWHSFDVSSYGFPQGTSLHDLLIRSGETGIGSPKITLSLSPLARGKMEETYKAFEAFLAYASH